MIYQQHLWLSIFILINNSQGFACVDTWEKRMMSYGSGNKQENYQAEMAKRAVANGFLFGKGIKGHVKIDL